MSIPQELLDREKRLNRLMKLGYTMENSLNFLDNSRIDAIMDLLVEKGICTNSELFDFLSKKEEESTNLLEESHSK